MKPKRKIEVDGKSYVWVLEGNEVLSSNRWIIVTLLGASYSRLYIAPYDHALEIKPANIALAIKAARKMGWEPESNSGEIRVKYLEGTFEQLNNI